MPDISTKQLLDASPEYFIQEICGLRITSAHQKMLDHIQGGQRQLTLCMRGLGKSLLTRSYIIWYALQHPNDRILIVSDTDTKAQSFLRAIKMVLESEKVKEYYGDVKGEVWTDHILYFKERTEIHAEGTISALGAGSGSVTDQHFDTIIIDDLVSFDSTRSELQRGRTKDWLLTSLLPTLMSSGKIIAVGTRYHFADVWQTLIDQLNYNTLILPPIKEDGTAQCDFLRPIEDEIDDKGVVIKVGLNTIKKELGSIIYSLQYENSIELLKEGVIIHYSDLKFYDKKITDENSTYIIKSGRKVKLVRIVVGADLAISEKERADYTAIVTTGRDKDGNIYVLDIVNEHLSFNQTIEKVKGVVERYHPQETIVESVGYQESLVQELRRTNGLHVRGIKPTRDKTSRLMAVSGYFESQLVHFTNEMTYAIEQLLIFPESGSHDDIVDAIVYSLMGQRRSTSGVIRLEF